MRWLVGRNGGGVGRGKHIEKDADQGFRAREKRKRGVDERECEEREESRALTEKG